MSNNITFIGGGNMARSLIGGMVANGLSASRITVSEPVEILRAQLAADFGVNVTDNNARAIANADCLLVAVKPQVMKDILSPLAEQLINGRPLIISIAAGITEPLLNNWSGGGQSIVRCMPNTPALVQEGATALYANSQVSGAQKQLAEQILSAVGLTLWVAQESQLDAVTAVSGSGPAYFFAFIEAMQAAGEKLGLSAEQAKQLTIQTALGAARMAAESKDEPGELRAKVTSKGGTTYAALQSFAANDLNGVVETALTAAHARSIELGKELS